MTTGTSTTRQVVAVVVAVAAGALGALILGEYDFSGPTPVVSGLLFGLVVAEVILTVARTGSRVLAIAASIISGLGVLWAGWISSGRGIEPIRSGAYVALVLAMIVAAGWVAFGSRSRRRA
jgi:hypothetical protein